MPAKIAGTAIDASLMRARRRQAAGQSTGTRQHPEPAEQRDGCAEKGECREDRGERTHTERVGGVGNNDRPGQHEQGLREPPQPLPFAPDERLKTQSLAASGVHVAALDGAPLDTMSRARPTSRAKKRRKFRSPTPRRSSLVRRIGPAGARPALLTSSTSAEATIMITPSLDADVVRQTEVEPPGRYAHH